MLADTQGQTQLNGVSENAPEVESISAWPGFLQVCGADDAKPRGQTLGIANSVAPASPPLKLPSDNPSIIASGCYAQKISSESSAGTTASSALLAVLRRPNPSARQINVCSRINKKLVCEECTKTRGRLVSFNCRKDLGRHMRTTKAHNARAVARCSCGKTVTRKDAKKSHRRCCPGSWSESTN